MNAAQLIEKLSKLDPETIIAVETSDSELGTELEEVTDIHDVSFVDRFGSIYPIVDGRGMLDDPVLRKIDFDNPPKVVALSIFTF